MDGHLVLITLVLLGALGAVFLRGFKEAIGIAVVLVTVYLGLNTVVVAVSVAEVIAHPHVIGDWTDLLRTEHTNWLAVAGVALLVFPKLAWGCPASRPAWR